jgi:hypothetical protein
MNAMLLCAENSNDRWSSYCTRSASLKGKGKREGERRTPQKEIGLDDLERRAGLLAARASRTERPRTKNRQTSGHNDQTKTDPNQKLLSLNFAHMKFDLIWIYSQKIIAQSWLRLREKSDRSQDENGKKKLTTQINEKTHIKVMNLRGREKDSDFLFHSKSQRIHHKIFRFRTSLKNHTEGKT